MEIRDPISMTQHSPGCGFKPQSPEVVPDPCSSILRHDHTTHAHTLCLWWPAPPIAVRSCAWLRIFSTPSSVDCQFTRVSAGSASNMSCQRWIATDFGALHGAFPLRITAFLVVVVPLVGTRIGKFRKGYWHLCVDSCDRLRLVCIHEGPCKCTGCIVQ